MSDRSRNGCRKLRNLAESGCGNVERTRNVSTDTCAFVADKSRRRFFKAQISFEFMTMFIVVMLAFLFFFSLYSEFNAVTHQNVLKDRAKATAYDIANAVNAILASENASMTFSIQHGYTVSAGVRSIIAKDSENNTGSAPILTDRLSITLPVNATNITVSKTGGMVYIYGS